MATRAKKLARFAATAGMARSRLIALCATRIAYASMNSGRITVGSAAIVAMVPFGDGAVSAKVSAR